jgi:hypothetical protein
MRVGVLVAALTAALAGFANADTPALPDGWSTNADGSYVHAQSAVVCAKTVGTYTFVRLDGPAEPNILGTCVYSGGDIRVGKIRVRTFVDGVGETPLAIQNDRLLMGRIQYSDVPAGYTPKFGERMGPGPEIEGQRTSQTVITIMQGGLLVDCITLTKIDKDEAMNALQNFGHVCAFPGGPPP